MEFLVNYFSYSYRMCVHSYTDSFPSSTAVKWMIMWNQICNCLVGSGIWSGKLSYNFQSAIEMQGHHVLWHSNLLLFPELCITQMLGAHGVGFYIFTWGMEDKKGLCNNQFPENLLSKSRSIVSFFCFFFFKMTELKE